MNYRLFGLLTLLTFPLFSFATPAVLPGIVTPGSRVEFTLAITADRPSPITEVRLFMPNAVAEVTPSVKQGWAVEIVAGGQNGLSEIAWRGGSIPPGYRDEFSFETSVAEDATEAKWIIIEGYKDGTMVSWDSDPAAEKPNPAPTTDIAEAPQSSDWYGKAALLVAALALVLGMTSLLRHF